MNEFTRKAIQLADDYSLARVRDEWMTWACQGMTAEEEAEKVMLAARSALLAHLEGAEQKSIERCPCGYPMPCNEKVPITFCKQAPATPTEEQP